MKNSNILLVVSSLAVVGVLGYLLMRQQKDTKNKYVLKPKADTRTIEEMRADFEKYGM